MGSGWSSTRREVPFVVWGYRDRRAGSTVLCAEADHWSPFSVRNARSSIGVRLPASEDVPEFRTRSGGSALTQAPHAAATAPPDWYPDPGVAGQWRYWDGTSSTMHVAPMRRSWTGRVAAPTGRPRNAGGPPEPAAAELQPTRLGGCTVQDGKSPSERSAPGRNRTCDQVLRSHHCPNAVLSGIPGGGCGALCG